MSGKGDSPRPIADRKQFEDNYDLAFRKGRHRPESTPSKKGVRRGKPWVWGGDDIPAECGYRDVIEHIAFFLSDRMREDFDHDLTIVTDPRGERFRVVPNVVLVPIGKADT